MARMKASWALRGHSGCLRAAVIELCHNVSNLFPGYTASSPPACAPLLCVLMLLRDLLSERGY